MSLVRPEIVAWASRRREAIAWTALTAFGLWLIGRGLDPVAPLLLLLGGLATLIGAALLTAALRRLAFAADAPAEGVVEIDEGRIAYLGPRDGGYVDVRALVLVEIVTRPHLLTDTGHAWVLSAEDGTRLTIPLGAAGGEGILDALSPLPGIDLAAGTAALRERRPARVVVWSRRAAVPAVRGLSGRLP